VTAAAPDHRPAPRRSLWAGVRERLSERHRFASIIDWSKALYDRAVLRWTGLPWPMRGRVVAVRLANAPRPVFARLGASDLHVVSEIFLHGEYDIVIQRLRAAGVQVRTILDLGANVGLSVRLWRDTFPGCRVVAVEPDQANLAVARLNADADAPPDATGGRATLVRACVAGVARRVTLDRSQAAWAFQMNDAPAAGTDADTIPALTIPQILEQTGVSERIDLLKCDIEGAERELFQHAHDWLHLVDRMVVEVHGDYTLDSLLADLRKADARPWRHELLVKGPSHAVVWLERQAA
jgi:FkbM family methyltransferase